MTTALAFASIAFLLAIVGSRNNRHQTEQTASYGPRAHRPMLEHVIPVSAVARSDQFPRLQ
jgi:hypothetical protein